MIREPVVRPSLIGWSSAYDAALNDTRGVNAQPGVRTGRATVPIACRRSPVRRDLSITPVGLVNWLSSVSKVASKPSPSTWSVRAPICGSRW